MNDLFFMLLAYLTILLFLGILHSIITLFGIFGGAAFVLLLLTIIDMYYGKER